MPSSSPTRPIIILTGPTAGGKTALAVELAERLPGGGECVSADSMQVYRGMNIGTATPDEEEQRGIPHHLLNVVDPNAPWTLDDWLRAAERAIDEIRGRGRWPIVAGGTNLYLQALLYGLVEGPPPDPALRDELLAMTKEDLRRKLESCDPDAAARIHPNDIRRAVRVIEYAQGTGEALSEAQVQWEDACRSDMHFIGLIWPTEDINRRINARVGSMMERGLLAEVRDLHERQTLGAQAATAVGYAQLVEHLEGRLTLEEATEQIKIRTRRFAKQQRTWLRRFRSIQSSTWLEPAQESPEDVINKAFTAASEDTLVD
ncbi:MAG: tRNA (adenosine(37)-N6)-dimethylallyltransferase MiaA [Phycisphaerales bacterium]|nr:tRNA (adenosine(37)-N6)-dimethylallyltransferase MiaA [Phycisphaerales bacterium]